MTVEWINPVTGVIKLTTFATEAEARAYMEGRERKYGRFENYIPPREVNR